MTTLDIGNNLKQIILFGIVFIVGVALFIQGYSTGEITTILASGGVILGGAGLAISEKIPIISGGNEEGNEKN